MTREGEGLVVSDLKPGWHEPRVRRGGYCEFKTCLRLEPQQPAGMFFLSPPGWMTCKRRSGGREAKLAVEICVPGSSFRLPIQRRGGTSFGSQSKTAPGILTGEKGQTDPPGDFIL